MTKSCLKVSFYLPPCLSLFPPLQEAILIGLSSLRPLLTTAGSSVSLAWVSVSTQLTISVTNTLRTIPHLLFVLIQLLILSSCIMSFQHTSPSVLTLWEQWFSFIETACALFSPCLWALSLCINPSFVLKTFQLLFYIAAHNSCYHRLYCIELCM